MNYLTFRRFDFNPFSLFDELEKGMTVNRDFAPPYSVSEKDTHYVLSFDLPGIPREDINIEVQEGQIRISGERKLEKKESDYTERHFGRFERVLALPEGTSENDVEAHYENGVLNIALGKIEKPQARKISVGNDRKKGIWGRLLGNSKNASLQAS